MPPGLLFLQCLVEEFGRIFKLELLCPGFERAVAGDLIVFDGLRAARWFRARRRPELRSVAQQRRASTRGSFFRRRWTCQALADSQLKRKLENAIAVIAKCELAFEDPDKAVRRGWDLDAHYAVSDFMDLHRGLIREEGELS